MVSIYVSFPVNIMFTHSKNIITGSVDIGNIYN